MAEPAIVNTSTNSNDDDDTGNSSLSASIAVGAGESLVVLTFQGNTTATSGVASVVFNGDESLSMVPGADVLRDAGSDARVQVWYLANPTATTANVVVTWGAGTQRGAFTAMMIDVPVDFGVPVTDHDFDVDPVATVSGTAGNLILDVLAHGGSPTTRTANGTQVEVVSGHAAPGTTNGVGYGVSTESSGLSVAMGWTLGDTKNFAYLAVELSDASVVESPVTLTLPAAI